MRVLLATNNPGKVAEFRFLLRGAPIEVTTPREEGLSLSVDETGDTLEANAVLKAQAFRAASGLLTLADDSGLFVDVLGGEPGVHSARYAGPGATDADRVRYLLRQLEGVLRERRTATFRCVIAIAVSAGDTRFAWGECHGIISLKPVGENGFGYDPVFVFPENGRTMAELSMAEKALVSHRGHAARAALTILRGLNQVRVENAPPLRPGGAQA